MKLLAGFLFITLVLGQIGSARLVPAVNVHLVDVAVLALWLTALGNLLKGRSLVSPVLLVPMGSFVAVGFMSLIFNPYRLNLTELGQSALYLGRWILYAGLYVIIVQALIKRDFWLWGLYGVGTSLAGLGLIQYFLYPNLRNLEYLGWDPHFYRVFSTLLDPNFAGIIFVLALFLGLFQWPRVKVRWVVFLAQILILIALILTFSRSSYLAFGIGLVIYVALQRNWRVLALFVIGFLGLYAILPKPGSGYLHFTRLESSLARIGNWQRTLPLIKESPFLGHGFNTLRFVQRNRGWTEIGSLAAGGTDSSLLFLLATTGMTGLGIYLWLLWRTVRLAVPSWKVNSGKELGVVYVASLGAVLVHSFFTNSLFYPWVMLWLWLLIGTVELSFRARNHLAKITSGKKPGVR